MNKEEVVNNLIYAQREYGLIETLHSVFGKNISISVGFTVYDCEAGIDELELSVRSNNALRRAGISTIGDLIDKLNAESVKNIRNLGSKSFREIQTKMLVFGFDRLTDMEKKAFFYNLVDNNTRNK